MTKQLGRNVFECVCVCVCVCVRKQGGGVGFNCAIFFVGNWKSRFHRVSGSASLLSPATFSTGRNPNQFISKLTEIQLSSYPSLYSSIYVPFISFHHLSFIFNSSYLFINWSIYVQIILSTDLSLALDSFHWRIYHGYEMNWFIYLSHFQVGIIIGVRFIWLTDLSWIWNELIHLFISFSSWCCCLSSVGERWID